MGSALPGTATVISVHRLGVIDNGRERHCTSVCAMRDASGAAEMAALAREEAAVGLLLCQECRQDLVRSVLAQRVPRN
jgi:hypothetical protein